MCSSVLLKRKRRGAYTASYGSTLRSIVWLLWNTGVQIPLHARCRSSSSRVRRADAKATKISKNINVIHGGNYLWIIFVNCLPCFILLFLKNITMDFIHRYIFRPWYTPIIQDVILINKLTRNGMEEIYPLKTHLWLKRRYNFTVYKHPISFFGNSSYLCIPV